jgi:selenide,water dikinase
VYAVSPDFALVQTVDFFAPIVDDPFQFGEIAAANALSDVFAMGGEPLTALNIAAFPTDTLPIDVLAEILRGAQSVVHEAGALVVGGHTIIDTEVKFGLAVTGRVHPDRMLRNNAARPGDRLVLTKPLGTGLLATALKQGRIGAEFSADLYQSMRALNAAASREAVAAGVRCATDVTGFGLLGHAHHVASASDTTLRFTLDSIPTLRGVDAALSSGVRSGGADRNEAFLASRVSWGAATDAQRAILVDPQTSGGLLLAIEPSLVDSYLSRVPGSCDVGDVVAPGTHRIALV